MSRVLRTAPAIEDILGIFGYIAADSVSAADRWLTQLDTTLDLLAENPELGELVDHLGPNVRRQVFGNFLIFYRPLTDGIELLRVLHGARRIDDLS